MLDSKRHVTAVIKLMASSPWLVDRAGELEYLLNECSSESELDLLFDLLSRFDYLGNISLSVGFNAMAEQILTGWSLDPVKTIVCPPKVDSSADSGPAVVQTLKSNFARKNVSQFELVVNLKKLKDHSKYRSFVVLVDDFAGTGRTIKGKLDIIRDLPFYKENPPKIYVCLLAAAQMARREIEPHVDGYFVWKEYARGISDHYSGPALSAAAQVMQDIEGRYVPVVRGVQLPNFGHGGTEVLMGWDSNLPNSVFPVFWWPESQTTGAGVQSVRKTLFSRYL